MLGASQLWPFSPCPEAWSHKISLAKMSHACYACVFCTCCDALPGNHRGVLTGQCHMQMQLPWPAQALYKAIGNPSVRLSAVAALALVAVWGMQASSASQDTDLSSMLEVRSALLLSSLCDESLVLWACLHGPWPDMCCLCRSQTGALPQ